MKSHGLLYFTLSVLVLAALACYGPALDAPHTPLPTPPPTCEPPCAVPTLAGSAQLTSTTPLEAPPTAPPALPRVAVITPDHQLVLVDPASGTTTPVASLPFKFWPGPHSAAGWAADHFYLLADYNPSDGAPPTVYEVGADGIRKLEFTTPEGSATLNGIAVWPGDGAQPGRIAWSAADFTGGAGVRTQLFISNVDGSDRRLVAEQTSSEGWHFVPFGWSADGQRLYYSEEPLGLGGYILFGGESSLSVYDLATGASRVLLPRGEHIICVDDLSPDETRVALGCMGIEIVDLRTGATQTVPYPIDAPQPGQSGNGLFSPAGDRLAYGLARGDYENEQGWIAVSDSNFASTRIVAASESGAYYHPVAWLDDNTLALERYHESTTSIWLVSADASAPPRQLIEGRFVGLVP